MASTSHLLVLSEVTRQFIRRGKLFNAVDHANLIVNEGEFIAIVGRSGNGKSTLINMVAGLIRPTSGSVTVDDRNVAALSDNELSVLRNRTLGFVTQGHTLLGNLTVLDNVILPATMLPDPLPFARDDESEVCEESQSLSNDEASAADSNLPDTIVPFTDGSGTKSADMHDTQAAQRHTLISRAQDLLSQLDVADLADSYPRELSGGEMRRVSIARALMNQPKLLIADEPTGDLDQESTDIVMRLLRAQADNGMAILMVTHDPDALAWADTVYRMDAGVLSKV
ncbi:ABC superfamily ATP binding cassette transporter, ABC protein [Bifidobacterium saguini DSM 23967]|uniref:ABC superfamily ATP binding cassette transporter, ABC protein n=2 Tax=Bifidobacterium saguini TaxID=762210 RepID=A0A087DA13_9BIFI|nr:ABC transporter ATP-binding protein [Bifidobacterium saguini]KFI92363.1 ABC superfamily ATP binding cassette transporter, ABC protein [Bifidobacterium saguini DSM 23967]QTB91062.1 ABC transporter ATP-binding protein [Bifidobacterium saguini]